MSGEVLRVMTLRAVSIATSVLNGGSSSIDCQPSSNATRTRGSNLPEAFVRAPRPRRRAPSTSVLATNSAWGSAPTSHIPPAGPKCDRSGSGRRRRTAVCRYITLYSAEFRTKQEQYLHPDLRRGSGLIHMPPFRPASPIFLPRRGGRGCYSENHVSPPGAAPLDEGLWGVGRGEMGMCVAHANIGAISLSGDLGGVGAAKIRLVGRSRSRSGPPDRCTPLQ